MAVLSPASTQPPRWCAALDARIDIIGELELGWRSCEIPVDRSHRHKRQNDNDELLAQMLNACGQRTIACGNIGNRFPKWRREATV